MHNWRRYSSSNWYKIWSKTVDRNLAGWFGASDAAEKKLKISAQLHSITCIKARKSFGKFTSCITGAHKLVYELWLLSALYSDVRQKLYRCTSTFLALNYYSWIFFKSLSSVYEDVRTTFPLIFGFFEIFERNFVKLVAPPSKIIIT